jgi:flagellin-like hook-associated protein FlgL
MSLSITGIPTSGITSQFARDQLTSILNAGQRSMYQLELAISSGHQFQLPSENPQSAIQVEGIQSLLERKDQMKSNISTTQSYLNQTDSALNSVSNLLTSIQATALSAVGSTTSAQQRQAVIEQIQQAVQELVAQGNQQLAGRQLFGGNEAASPPFSIDGSGNVVYSGSSASPHTYIDLNRLFNNGMTGDEAFGAMSQPIQGAALTPAVSASTLLSQLNGGRGVAAGSIAVSDGHSTSVIDLRSASTLGDVARLIEQNPPAGRTVDAEVTSSGLTISLQPSPAYPTGDNLTIKEVNGNSTAHDLGILNTSGTGASPIVGQGLSPVVTPGSWLDDLFGTRATAFIHFNQPNSDIVLQANTTGSTTATGTLLNGVTVQFVADAPFAGQESATFAAGTPASGGNPGTPGTLTVHISTSAVSASNATQIVKAINSAAGLPFTASLDPANQDGGVPQPLSALPAVTTTAGGSGTTFDTSGLQIVSEGKTYTINMTGDKTVQDLLNSINGSGAGLDAEINATNTGINVRSRVSGSSFSIGENGGTTAAQLGIRTFTTATSLSQLNFGRGVGVNTATPGGTDFTISQTLPGSPPNTVQVAVSIAGDTTVGDVLQTINTAAQAAGATFQAQLDTTGNGIELTVADSTQGPIVVTANPQSTAAADLGLVPAGQASAQAATAPPAQATVGSGPNSELSFQAVNGGTAGNVQVVFQTNPAVTQGNETAAYDPVAKTLTFQISPQTTANDVITALQNNAAASAAFTASLDTTNDPTNNGTGIVQPQTVQMTGGQPITLAGSDVNLQETGSVFNALIKLSAAFESNDDASIQRTMGLLSTSMQNLGNARTELGAREQSLSAVTTQINNEELNLQSTMSNSYDTDMANAVSQYTAAQIAYQATLQTTASLMRTTLLNYLPPL